MVSVNKEHFCLRSESDSSNTDYVLFPRQTSLQSMQSMVHQHHQEFKAIDQSPWDMNSGITRL